MLGENIKTMRKTKGLTQEELAIRLHVVRQTVSKWEKNLSVPDAGMMERLAEVLDSSVSQLLGEQVAPEANQNEIAQQLSRINEQLAVKNRRARKIWTVVAIILAVSILVPLILMILGLSAYGYRSEKAVSFGMNISESNPLYKKEEVETAFAIVRKYMQGISDCRLIRLSYDEDASKAMAEEMIASYPGQDIIVLRTGFSTGSRVGGGWLPNHLYEEQETVLTRSGSGNPWQLQQIAGRKIP